MAEEKKEEKKGFDWKSLLASLPWLELLAGAYKGLRPYIAKKVLDSESKWDDLALDMADGLAKKFLGDNLLEDEKDAKALVAAAKSA